MVTPIMPRWTLPLLLSWLTTSLAMLEGMAKPYALARGDDGRVDADHLAVEVDERTAGVAGVDGGVCLDEVVVGSGPDDPALGRDDARRDRVGQAEGVADGHGPSRPRASWRSRRA